MDTETMPGDKRPYRSAAFLLKQERERRGWTQSELAKRIGTTQVNISRWEKGTTFPGPYYRQRLGSQFGKTIEELGLVQEAESDLQEEANTSSPSLSSPVHQADSIHKQLWNIPYRRNPFFTGREEILTALYTILNSHKAAALTQAQAISGLGGIGKTQIAVEYAYRYRNYYQAILWVTGSSRDTLLADFAMLAKLLDLQEQHEQDQDIVVRAVKRWLSTQENWLLILDNVDDVEMAVDFLPMQGVGNILLTTRQQALGSIAQSIEVVKMGVEEGVMFLARRTMSLTPNIPLEQSMRENQALAVEIVTALDGLPLALDQAGAYIEETRCGFSAYLDLYRTRRKELLSRRGRFPLNHPEPVAATWSLSFEQIEQENSAAADLLRLLVFFNPDAIAEEIISEGAAELGPTLAPVASDPLELDAAIELLLRYSLLRRNPEKKFLSIHRLVQAVLKDGMEQDAQLLWVERAIRAINVAFPDVQPETWGQCQRCLSHAQMSATHIEEYKLNFPEAARLLNQAANYLSTHAQYAQAEPLLKQAMAIRQSILEPAHPDIAFTLNDIGMLYLTQGKYQQAEPLLQQALDIRQKVLKLEHPAIAQSLNNLAELYRVQGKYTQAEPLYLQALSSQKKALGLNHPDVAKILNNLALLYRSQGAYSQAEQYYQQALSIQEQVLGLNHPDVAETLNNLARLYRAQGDYPKAERFYLHALHIREDMFGPDHPLVAQSLYSLAKLYYSQGKYRQAEESGRQSLNIQEQRLGINHPDLAYTLGILARIYQVYNKQPDEAEALYRRALAIRENALGSSHPQVALSMSSLAEVYHAQGRYLEARPLILRSLAIREQTLGPDHPYLAYSLSNLAENYSSQGDYRQAEIFYKKALAIREKALGNEHPYTASAHSNLARLYFIMGRHQEAEFLYFKAQAILEQTLGTEHPDVAASLENIAIFLHKTGREKQACEFEVRAKAIKMKAEKQV